MPAMFALGDKVIKNPEMSYFIVFGSFAMLLLTDFGGSLLDRARSQTTLGVCCAILITLGTLASHVTAVAVVCMFLAGLVIVFSGVVSSVIASASTPLLLAFILPVTNPGPVSEIPERVAGWGIAAAVSVVAITVLWPSPAAFPIEGGAIAALRALAARTRAQVAWSRDGGEEAQAAYAKARADADARVDALDKLFLTTPYRLTGLSTKARAEIRLVDELHWLGAVILRAGAGSRVAHADRTVCAVKEAAADVLDQAAAALDTEQAAGIDSVRALAGARERMRLALAELEHHATLVPLENRGEIGTNGHGPVDTDRHGKATDTNGRMTSGVVSALDPSFRAQEIAYVTEQIAGNVEYAVAASRRTWVQRLLGQQPAGFTGPLSSARERALAHAEPSSSWLHNSMRAASALALAVLVADLTSVQHGFWVVFGTLAVLRSNALSTGQNVLRGLLGTTVGFAVGGALVWVIGTNTVVLWVILPFVVLFAGLAPSTISFAAGQAAFTVVLLVVFNLLVPAGWKLGLIRVEDVAIGGAVSVVIGLLFWPRGAGADLGRALGRAYIDSSSYLAGAIDYAVACCGAPTVNGPAPRALALTAAASARRLDDTFRGYLTERGTKKLPLAEAATLVTGVAGLRLAADAVLDLWDGDRQPHDGDRASARHELLATAQEVAGWYDRFAASLVGAAEVPAPLPEPNGSDNRLVEAVAGDLNDGDGHATATGVRVIWTGDHLDAVRRLQETLVGPARVAAVEA
jgi:hypothetical protein